jgi:hypothetical protein
MVRARPDVVPATSNAAVETRSARRDSAEGKPLIIVEFRLTPRIAHRVQLCHKQTPLTRKKFRHSPGYSAEAIIKVGQGRPLSRL